MADHSEKPAKEEESLLGEIMEKFHGHDSSSSSSDSDDEKSMPSINSKIYRLFGRKQPVHKILGGGKPADIFLWRDKKVSAVILGGVTGIWVLFELLNYHLLTLVCHLLILALTVLFLWSKATTSIKKSPPHIPEVSIPEDLTVKIAHTLRYEINRVLSVLREISLGSDLKKFLVVIAGLWVLSILGTCCNFLTLFYIVFVALYTIPVLYEKYQDKVDSFAEKAMFEIKKQYVVFDAKVLSKIPKGPLKDKKF